MPALTSAMLALAALSPGDAAGPTPSDVIAIVNAVRLDPAGYGSRLATLAHEYRGTVWAEQDGTEHNSIEGAAAATSAASALRTTAGSEQLALDPVLTAAARSHVAAQGPTGQIGHASGTGATPGLRVRAAGGDVYVAEVIAYGMHDAEDVVRELVVDDGLPSRGHRRLLLAAFYRYAGIACGPHATQGTMCVIDLAATPGGRIAVPTR